MTRASITHAGSARLSLPAYVRACLFDLDGVLIDTATAHAAAWKETIDAFLAERAARLGQPFVPFDADADYRTYVDGRQREDGLRSFLASRSIDLPEGSPDDPPGRLTVHDLAGDKNRRVLELLERDGIETFACSIRYLRAAGTAGLVRAVVTASANCGRELELAGITDLFEVRVDAIEASRRHLRGKPAPDMFLAAAAKLDVPPAQAAVFEDSIAGVTAADTGEFGFIVGIARTGSAEPLLRAGADIVVHDLGELIGADGDPA
jgi:beta-phosphoglucomutase family hydrolase